VYRKACRSCGVAKPRSEFYAHSTNRDRLQGACKPCYSARNMERYRTDPEYRARVSARSAARVMDRYRNDPEFRAQRIAKLSARKDADKATDPVGAQAYKTAHNRAVRARGSARTHTCECGSPAQQWAFICGREQSGQFVGMPYGPPESYEAMCVSCHVRMDKAKA
jgi:hypothetical protein